MYFAIPSAEIGAWYPGKASSSIGLHRSNAKTLNAIPCSLYSSITAQME
jgi:hypothetical protein